MRSISKKENVCHNGELKYGPTDLFKTGLNKF